MHTYRLTISYDGGRYSGWQRQKNTDRTIQAQIEWCLKELIGIPVEIHGSGRTDGRVNAFGQEASFRIKKQIDVVELWEELNQILPEDIRILRVREEEDGFHARKSAVGKCYEYYVDLSNKSNVFSRKYCFHFPYRLQIDKMEEAACHLIGTHDFSSFTDLRVKEDVTRTIYAIRIIQEGEQVKLSFYGDGFLYHMVRILTGTLLNVGIGKIQPEQIPAILSAKNRKWAGFPAPANGLFLKQVFYDEEEMKPYIDDSEIISEKIEIIL